MSVDSRIGSGFSQEELSAASWWVKHRLGLRRFLLALGFTIIALSWGYALWTAFDSYILSWRHDQAIPLHILTQELNPGAITALRPQALQPSDVSILPASGGRKSFLVHVGNPNPNWWAEITYHFSIGDTQTSSVHSFILPQSQRYLTLIGWTAAPSVGAQAQIQVDNLVWHRVDPRNVEGSYTNFANRRLQLSAINTQYNAAQITLNKKTIPQTNFILQNLSAYGFTSVDLTVVLFQGGAPVDVALLNEQNILPGENRPISLNWFDGSTVDINKTDVSADVNILDPSVFLSSNHL